MSDLIRKWQEQDSELYGHSYSRQDDVTIEKQIKSLWPERIIEAKNRGDKQAADYAVVHWRQTYYVEVFDADGIPVFVNSFDTITESSLFIASLPPGYQHRRSIV